jgi:hypothetical protein
MALTNTGPIKRGIVRLLRSSPAIVDPLRGGIHERVSSRQVAYPYLIYSQVGAPVIWDSGPAAAGGTREIRSVFDISVLATRQVDAETIDELIDALFSGHAGALDALVDGQTVYHCERIADMPTGPDRDEEGRFYDQKGGTYEIWTTQPII